MLSKLHKDNKGFTIIEVLIVLAIAGLIMLIVFLAVPALQRNQRNNARNNDASRIAAAVTECLANRNGDKANCNNGTEIQAGTLNQLSIPAGDWTDGQALGTGSTTAVVIGYQRTCDTPGADDVAGGVREFAVMWINETGINRCVSS
jgi:prepilin-type N-terminal cleavage/methylation domain-containing protein